MEDLVPEFQAEQPPSLAGKPATAGRNWRGRHRVSKNGRCSSRCSTETCPAQSPQLAGEPLLQRHGEAHLVATLEHGLRQIRRRYARLDQMLHLPALELHVGGNGRRELDQRMIEQRHPAFQAMRHAHAILDMEQRRQQALEIEMRHLVEIGFLLDVVADC